MFVHTVMYTRTFIFRPYKFQQDGAPAHRALSTTAWLRRKKVQRFNGGVWPGQSPDLNPIEHLWPLVLNKLRGSVFAGKDELWSALQGAFAEIQPAQIQALYHSMPNRMKAVIAAKGGHTRY